MMENSKRQRVFDQELHKIDGFRELIYATLGIDAQIKAHSVVEGKRQTKAYRIRLSNRDAHSLSLILATDFDDTLEKYTKRKEAYHQHLADLLREVAATSSADLTDPTDIISLLGKINKIARCLPTDGTHPEYYAPKLELLMETHLLELARQNPVKFQGLSSLDVKSLREYLVQALSQQLSDVETVKELDKNDNPKLYFLEKAPLTMEIDFGASNFQEIDQELWQLFVKDMTGANLDEGEVSGMDMPEEVYWLITTFGVAQFQIRKVTAGLQKLQQQGQRLPDEIVIITQGRKDMFLQELFGNLLHVFGKKIVYLDDSKSQLESVVAKLREKVQVFLAVKMGAMRTALVGKSAVESGLGKSEEEPSFPSVDLDQLPLKEFVGQFLVEEKCDA